MLFPPPHTSLSPTLLPSDVGNEMEKQVQKMTEWCRKQCLLTFSNIFLFC